MGYGCCVRIRGNMALMTRPEMKGERTSYHVLTPSAARGIIEAIYWHPALSYKIDKVTVLSPIRFDSIRRNEVGKVVGLRSIQTAGKTGGPLYLDASRERQQRASAVLRDVDYLVDFHFEIIPEKMGQEDDPKKFYNILLRRLRKGQHFSQPYLGCREFPAWVSIVEEGEPRPEGAYRQTPEMDLGLMLYDVDYERNCAPILFHAVMRHGEIVPEVIP